MNEGGSFRRAVESIRNSVSFKLAVVGFLVIILLIPTVMVQSLIGERQDRKANAVSEISQKWGAAQTITGPVLTVPYRQYYKRENGHRAFHIRYAHFLPKRLNVAGTLNPEIRYRGIYKAVLYQSTLRLDGQFERPDFRSLDIDETHVLWNRASVSLGISDMKGIRDAMTLQLGQHRFDMQPGMETQDLIESGVSARIPAGLARESNLPFALKLDLNGSDHIHVVPVGKVTRVSLASPWKSPSFDGAFLPYQRHVGAKGFDAKWKVLNLNRNFPQAWVGPQKHMDKSAFGTRLIITADVYQQATRTAKYAVLFILLTFTTFFFSEIINRRRLHPIQYLLIGFALLIFYSLLIALSEHMQFGLAYFVSSAAVVGLITIYARWALGSVRLAALVGGILVILYGYLYTLLQLEDYALLMGSIGLFAALACVMYVTRKIDWYGGEADTGR